MFSARIRQTSLAAAFRSLSTLLGSGVPILRAFDIAARKSFDARTRGAFAEIASRLREGAEIATAMTEQDRAFPELARDMVAVAEQSGALPEVLGALADHYENNVRLRRQFVSAITWPALQFIAAVLIIGLVILILGAIAGSRGGEPMDVTGLGLSGPSGALIWLCLTFGSVGGLILAYALATRSLEGKRYVDPWLMRIPVVGSCMRSFAIARFSWAYYLTQQTGMPIRHSLELSLRATGNGAFTREIQRVCFFVEQGDELSVALAESGLFPEEYLQMVSVAETSGTVPEMLHRMSPQFEEAARRSLERLTAALGWTIWAMVATFIIYLIFRIALSYVAMIDDAVRQTY